MRLTNKYNLPQPLVDAIANDGYSGVNSPKAISVSTLFKPPRVVALERKHGEDLEVDAIDSIWSLLGQAVHTILERANKSDIVEKRYGVEFNGWYVNGQLDSYTLHDGLLRDWKTVSAWAVVNSSKDSDWTLQLNAYAWLLRRHGFTPRALQIVAIIRDWSKREAQRNPDYPQKQVSIIDLPMLPDEAIEAYIAERLELHGRAIDELPDCTPAERWLKPTKYAVMKVGGKRAIKLFDNVPDAEAWIQFNRKPNEKLEVQERRGEPIRCQSYCAVGAAGLCAQWAADPANKPEVELFLPEDLK